MRFEVVIDGTVIVEFKERVEPIAVFHCVFEASTLEPTKLIEVVLRPIALDQLRFEVTNPLDIVRFEAINRLHEDRLQNDP